MTAGRNPRDATRSAWCVVVVCAVAALAALRAPVVAAPGGAPGDAGPVVHGLAPLPGGRAVPLSLRPPGALPDDGGPSPVIFPPQTLGIRFNHARHVKELGMTCTTCHDAARTSRSSADSLLPHATRCDACHGTNHRVSPVESGGDLIGACGYCHVGYKPSDGQRVARLEIPPPNLRFDHALHVGRSIECKRCHGDVGSLELATADQLPRMKGCFDCHTADRANATPRGPKELRGASRACPTCHVTERGGLMKTSFAGGKLLPPAWLHDSEHGPDWIERHKKVAANEGRFCGSCHQERYCADCHDGRVRPRRVHPNDFISMHPVQARRNEPRCTSCHQEQSFCLSCHQRAGVTLTGPSEVLAGRGRFHPPPSIWTDGPRTASHHAREAERNLNACVSCHIERDCAICHATAKVGGRGGELNPHPPGFSARCRSALRKNARPCLVCHDPADPNLGRCQ
ncbi:MAG TPA: cytochrome c3 family protein [Polyangiaceae bacterium]